MRDTPPEVLMEWLESMELPIEDTVTIEKFQARLGKFLNAGTPTGRAHQIDALSETMLTKYTQLLPRGIRPIQIRYHYGTTLRFSIKGLRGLFGLKGMENATGEPIGLMWKRVKPKYK